MPPVPIQESVAEFISALLGLGSAATKVQPARIEADGAHVVGIYRDDLGRVAALVTADLAMAASSGAALAMIPSSAARDVVDRGALSDTLLDNFREVANITATLLNTPTTPHLRLDGVWLSDDPDLPHEAWDLLAAATKHREFLVTIDGYGTGRLGIAIG